MKRFDCMSVLAKLLLQNPTLEILADLVFRVKEGLGVVRRNEP